MRRRRRKPGVVVKAKLAWKLAGVLLALVAGEWRVAWREAAEVVEILKHQAIIAGDQSDVDADR